LTKIVKHSSSRDRRAWKKVLVRRQISLYREDLRLLRLAKTNGDCLIKINRHANADSLANAADRRPALALLVAGVDPIAPWNHLVTDSAESLSWDEPSEWPKNPVFRINEYDAAVFRNVAPFNCAHNGAPPGVDDEPVGGIIPDLMAVGGTAIDHILYLIALNGKRPVVGHASNVHRSKRVKDHWLAVPEPSSHVHVVVGVNDLDELRIGDVIILRLLDDVARHPELVKAESVVTLRITRGR
jgi:hypothetical protein